MDGYSERAHQESIRKKLAARRNGFSPVDIHGGETLFAMFDRQVPLHPGKPAVVSGGETVTYAALARASRDIAYVLGRRMHGGKTPIAVLVARRTDFAAAALGVLRASGFYVPLDPTFPETRNSQILHRAEARVILTDRKSQQLAERLATADQALIYLDEVESGALDVTSDVNPDDLACIIFTSGSTGQPKGVMQTHATMLQIVKRYTNSTYLGCDDRTSLLSSCSVTASIAPLWSSLLNGATALEFPVREGGLAALADWLDTERISLYHSVPSLFRHLMKSLSRERVLSTIQVVRLGGDSVYLNDWELFTQHCSADCVLLNGYGCSEMSSASGFYMDSASQITDSVLPVGYPLGDVGISVVDDQGRTSMVGASADSPSFIGEIVLQSRYLSPGYWQDVAASDASYSAVEGDNGARNYRSKDLATVRGDQGLVHVGRGDAQVKISGFRVEVAEVEACMRNYPGVRDAAAIVRTAGHGERELIGFVGMESRDIECGPDVRSYMLGKLPDHMVPSEIVALADVPCTPNGKIDRSALLKLRDGVWWGRARQAPRTQIEQVVSEIWMQALNIRQIGIEDNFFELGGNSLLGMALIVRIAESFAVQLPALAVFQYPTVRQMAQYIDRLLPTSHGMAESGQVGVEEGVI